MATLWSDAIERLCKNLGQPRAFFAAVMAGAVIGLSLRRCIAIVNRNCKFARSITTISTKYDADSLARTARKHGSKLVLVVRKDLGMSSGKVAAQAAHATLACYKTLMRKDPKLLRAWENDGQAKVTVQAESEAQIKELVAKAHGMGLAAEIIYDAGRTQIAAGSATVLGVGPGPIPVSYN